MFKNIFKTKVLKYIENTPKRTSNDMKNKQAETIHVLKWKFIITISLVYYSNISNRDEDDLDSYIFITHISDVVDLIPLGIKLENA